MRALRTAALVLGASTTAFASSSVADRLATTLASHRSPSRPSEAVLVERLVPLGDELLLPAFEILADRRIPLAGADDQVLSEPQRDILLDTFTALGRGSVFAAERGWRAELDDPDTTCARLRIRGSVGTVEDVDFLILQASATDELDRRRVQEALRPALASTLRRDPRALDRLAGVWRDLRPDLLPTLVAAVGDAGDARGVDILLQVCSGQPEVAPDVMAQVRVLGPAPSHDVNESLALTLRKHLDPTDAQRCAAAAVALAVLEDVASVPTLVSLLESESEGVRRNSAWALGQLTGMRFPADAELWQRWLSEEKAWEAGEKRQALFRLRSIDPGMVTASVREISRHRLYRHELSTELGPLLRHRNANLRRVACAGMQQLGSRRALPFLAAALDDTDPEVVRAARVAIASIAGVEADDAEALQEAVDRADP